MAIAHRKVPESEWLDVEGIPGEYMPDGQSIFWAARTHELAEQCLLIRDIFGNPFRPISFSPEWRTTTAVAIALGMYDSRDFGPMPLLADVLQDAGCEVPEIIDHCRGPGPHVRGCWVVDGVLGKV